jgi:hypothetical protein
VIEQTAAAAEARMSLSSKAALVHTDGQFEPSDLESAMHLSQLLARSTMVPKHFQGKPEDLLLTMMMARQYGLPSILLIQEGHVINGKFGLPAIMLHAQCQRHPDCELMRVIQSSDTKATLEVKRKSWPTPVTIEFTLEEARKAGLLSKGGSWGANPTAMLIARVRSRGARTFFPEVATGLYSIEELRDGGEIVVDAAKTEAQGFHSILKDAKKAATVKQIAAPPTPIVFAEAPGDGPGIPVAKSATPIIESFVGPDPEVHALVTPPDFEPREPGSDDDLEGKTGDEIGTLYGYPPPETTDRPRGRGRR